MLIKSNSANNTKKIANRLAKDVGKNNKKTRVFALVGDLGSGKTTFVKSFLWAMGIRRRVISPTFLLIKSYQLNNKNYKLIYHIDAYRINKTNELLKLGLKDILNNKEVVVLIEWADKIKKNIPKSVRWIYFNYGEQKNERIITIK